MPPRKGGPRLSRFPSRNWTSGLAGRAPTPSDIPPYRHRPVVAQRVRHEVQTYLAERLAVPAHARIVVGLSGGLDSVVLTHVLKHLGHMLTAVHVNYHLRRDASERDEAFVRALCSSWDVPLQVVSCPLRAQGSWTASMQEQARDARYAAFERVALEHDAAYVAVAHHRGDQAETVLLHLFRGTGLEGLAGMAPLRPVRRDSPVRLIRPLLEHSRRSIAEYAEAEGLSWREDASNATSVYRRNTLRHDIVPLVEEHFGEGVTERIARAAELVRAYLDAVFDDQLTAQFDRLCHDHSCGGGLEVASLMALPEVWQGRLILEALRRWLPEAPRTAAMVDTLRALLSAQPGRTVPVAGGAVWRERESLLFLAGDPPQPASPATLDEQAPVELPSGTIRLERDVARPDDVASCGRDVVFVNADRLQGPLQVRSWRSRMRRWLRIDDGTSRWCSRGTRSYGW